MGYVVDRPRGTLLRFGFDVRGSVKQGLDDVIRLIAQLGGFLGRKGDGEPGVKTLWLGLQRLVDFIAGMHAARDIYV